jgi:hypothetical protein
MKATKNEKPAGFGAQAARAAILPPAPPRMNPAYLQQQKTAD